MNAQIQPHTSKSLILPEDSKRIILNTKNFRRHVVAIDPALKDACFYSSPLPEELPVELRFEPLDAYPTMVSIMMRANELMAYDRKLMNLTFRSLCFAMKENDSLLKEAIGKTIIIPYTFYRGFGEQPRSVIFTPESLDEAKWNIVAVKTQSLYGGIKSILPVLQRI